jgi:hypothetical protein
MHTAKYWRAEQQPAYSNCVVAKTLPTGLCALSFSSRLEAPNTIPTATDKTDK